MLGYLPYESRLGQRDITGTFKAYPHAAMSTIPPPSSLYSAPPSSGHPAYSMDYRLPPTYDAAGGLMDLSNATPTTGGHVKVEDYYLGAGSMPPHYSYNNHAQEPHPKGGTAAQQLHMNMDSGLRHPLPSDDPKLVTISPSGSDHSSNGGAAPLTNGTEAPSRMPPKKRPLAVPEELKDEGYWDKRKKNNDSAKRSREQRRMKEEQIAMRVVYLEQENLQLRTEVSLLKTEIEKLRVMLYNT